MKSSREIDIQQKKETMSVDMLVSGMFFFRVSSEDDGQLEFEVLNPRHTHIDRNPDSPYVRNARRVAYVKYLSRSEVLARYGSRMDEAQKKTILKDYNLYATHTRNMYFTGNGSTSGAGNGYGAVVPFGSADPFPGDESKNPALIPVYYVEWLESNYLQKGEEFYGKKYKYVQDRYNTIRIGNDIFLLDGRDESAPRSISKPNLTRLSVNGLCFSDRNGQPYSLVLNTMDLQDMYDLLNFYMETLISNSGTKGMNIDLRYIPMEFGKTLEERLVRTEKYIKAGRFYFNSADPEYSDQLPGLANTHFNGFDNSVSLESVQAIELAMQKVENTVSQFTGVFRQNLANGIVQQDAVTNVETGLKQSAIITRKYFHTLDFGMKEIYTDLINVAKIAYKNGYKGMATLGEKNNAIFTVAPEYYTSSDFDVHVGDSAEIISEREMIRQLSFELTKSEKVDPRLLVTMMTSKSLTAMKQSILKSIDKKEEETGQLTQMTQQMQQLNQLVMQYEKQIQTLQAQNQQLSTQTKQAELQLKNRELNIKEMQVKSDAEYKRDMVDVQEERTKIEQMQLFDQSKKNDEIKYDT
jgi:hypothetical protein